MARSGSFVTSDGSGRESIEEVEGGVDEPEGFGRGEVVDTRDDDGAGIAEGGDQIVDRSDEVEFADDQEHRTGDDRQIGRCRAPTRRAPQHGRQGTYVVTGLEGVVDEEAGDVRRVGGELAGSRRLEGVDDHGDLRRIVLEDVAPDTSQYQRMETLGMTQGGTEQCEGPEREADGVDRSVGQGGEQPGLQIGVGLGVMGLGRCPVTEEVDADRLATGIGEESHQAGPFPGLGGRSAPPVDEDHRRAGIVGWGHGLRVGRGERAVSLGICVDRSAADAVGTNSMRMLHPHVGHDLTYNDVFMVPSLSDVGSRSGVDLTTPDRIGTTIPIVVSNMTAVAGRRMAETVARRGGLAVLPQDIPIEVIAEVVSYVKTRHPVFETPIMLAPHQTIGDALGLIHKRAHGAVVVVDDEGRPLGVFTEHDAEGFDRFTQLQHVMSTDLVTLDADVEPARAFDELSHARLSMAPVIDGDGRLLGVLTTKGALRSTIYRPAVDTGGRLMVSVAVGINADPVGRAAALVEMGVDVLVVDTAHGHQTSMLSTLEQIRAAVPTAVIVAGNVVTADGTRQLIEAGADIVKVGVGPGAMCTTRMMTGVGRPQFTAVVECSDEAARTGHRVWADGGIRFPRDVALALAGGAANVMFGSWLAGTFESAADTLRDPEGRLYKESFGMASNRAVRNRNRSQSVLEAARRELFEEGISSSRMYLDPRHPGVEDIIDQIVAGVRSACTYAGASNLVEFHERAVVGVQSYAGYDEGRPVGTSW